MVVGCFDLEGRSVESWQFVVTVIQSWVPEGDACLLLVVHLSFLVTTSAVVVMYWWFLERVLLVAASVVVGCVVADG